MYTAAAGMAAQQQRIDAVSNDLANLNTAGYKHTRIAFRDLVYTQAPMGAARGVAEGSGAAATTIGRSAAQGALIQTGRTLDVAIQGSGYLQVRRANGQLALTRAGNLQLDNRRRLTTSQGELVQPTITLPAGATESDVDIASDGTVEVRGQRIGRLRLVDVPAPAGLLAQGDNTFAPTTASGPVRPASARTTLQQGALEGSNVDLADAMSDLVDAQRSYELASKAIQMQDQMAEIANGVKR